MAGSEEMVLVGVVAGAHGVRGAVRVKTFTETPEGIAAYGPLFDETGARRIELRILGTTKTGVIAQLPEVVDRNAAEALRGLRLHVPRAALPATAAEEFYHADLIGLAAETVDGEALGQVVSVHNHGAGDLLEVARPDGGTLALPFTRAVVPVVDLAARRLVVDPPLGLLEEEPVEEEPAGTGAQA